MQTLYDHAAVRVELHERSVQMRAEGPHVCVSHAPLGGALRAARTIAIHETANDELTPEVDAIALLASRMADVDPRGIGMWTSRRVASAVVTVREGSTGEQGAGVRAVALVTAGLSNAVRVGDTPGPLRGWGTINIACHVNVPLSPSALIEALTIAVEARTTAVLDAGVRSRRSERVASGTGTDCVAIMAPEGERDRTPAIYAGKHTTIGYAVGDAVLAACESAVTRWKREVLR